MTEKSGDGKLTIRDGSGGGIIDGGEGSRVKVNEPGNMPKNISDIVGLPRKGGMTVLG